MTFLVYLPRKRFSLGHLSPASGLRSFNIASIGRVTCPECVPLYSHVLSCLENSPAARDYSEAQNEASLIGLILWIDKSWVLYGNTI